MTRNELVAEARNLAEDNYSTWGQWVVECMTDAELSESLGDARTLAEWVAIRKVVASAHCEIESTAW